MSFAVFNFDSPPHPSGGRGGKETAWSFVADRGQTMTLRFVRMFLSIHVGLLLPFLDFLLVVIDYSSTWRRWSLKINQLSWTHLFSRAVSHGILPSRSLNRSKCAVLKSRIAILLFALLLPLMVLNSTIAQSLQSAI